MTTYYRDLISGEIFNESDAWNEALDRIDYAEALAQLLNRYSAAEIIENMPADIQDDIFDHAAEQYINENFEECDEPEEEDEEE
jgi:Mg/Co/Ni transporter MgtE